MTHSDGRDVMILNVALSAARPDGALEEVTVLMAQLPRQTGVYRECLLLGDSFPGASGTPAGILRS
jgi:hypothetical protein